MDNRKYNHPSCYDILLNSHGVSVMLEESKIEMEDRITYLTEKLEDTKQELEDAIDELRFTESQKDDAESRVEELEELISNQAERVG